MGRLKGYRLAALMLTMVLAAAGPASADTEPVRVAAGSIQGEVLWKGTCLIEGPVTVAPGSTLVVEAGAALHFFKDASLSVGGTIRAEGTAARPIVLATASAAPAGELWPGVGIQEGGSGRFTFCRWQAARKAVSAIGASLEIEDSSIEGCEQAAEVMTNARLLLVRCRVRENKAGVDVPFQSTLVAADSAFENNGGYSIRLLNGSGRGRISGSTFKGSEIGIILNRASDVLLIGNTFSGLPVGLVLDQIGPDIRLSGNGFEGGGTGVMILRLASPWIACDRFTGLQTALTVERFCNPMVTNNLFLKNKTAVSAVFKSNFPLKKNVFRENERAIFTDLAAYPAIHENNFMNNGSDIVLGPSMSADYENRVGTGNVTRQNAEQSRSRNMGALNQDKVYDGILDASRNWWGAETTREMKEGGPDANIRSILDSHDTPEVSYPGWVEGVFKMDRVRFDPWEEAEVPEAGPLPGGCGDLNSRPGASGP